MKNRADLETSLMNELKFNWFAKQCANPTKEFYLYYLPTKPEHIGHISICSEVPANEDMILAHPHPINTGMTIEQNFHWFSTHVIDKLPVLEY